MSSTSVDLSPPPILVIEPRRGWVALKLKEVWAYRELLYFLVWRDVKVRYKQTVARRGLGDPPAPADDARVHDLLRTARPGRLGWPAVSGLLARGTPALGASSRRVFPSRRIASSAIRA